MTRVAAMVHVAVFDAVNGLDPRYSYFHVEPAGAPAGASKRAAAVQAAYAMLTRIYGSLAQPASGAQQATFDARRTVSLAAIAEDDGPAAIASGIAWGQSVAEQIFAWRATDGFSVTGPFADGALPGQWRRTPNLPVSSALSAPGAGYLQLSHQTPWAIQSPSAFRPGAPPALTSAEYTRDFNEVKKMGSFASEYRSPEQTVNALFWNSATVSYLWNQVALSLLKPRHDDHDRQARRGESDRQLLENARILGVLEVAMADAIIGCWDAKYFYAYWRPITAIRDTMDDGDPATSSDPNWMPLFANPGHPDYPSGHSCASGAAAAVLRAEFGEYAPITLRSDLMLGVTQKYRGPADALDKVVEARVFAGIHFRTACDIGTALGSAVAEQVMSSRFQRIE
jgi:PAP2 superfamily